MILEGILRLLWGMVLELVSQATRGWIPERRWPRASSPEQPALLSRHAKLRPRGHPFSNSGWPLHGGPKPVWGHRHTGVLCAQGRHRAWKGSAHLSLFLPSLCPTLSWRPGAEPERPGGRGCLHAALLSSRPRASPESPLLASHLSLGTFQKSPRKTTQARVPVYFTAWSTDTSPRCRGWGVGIRTCTQNLENGTVGPDGASPTRLKALCVSTRTCAGARVCAHTCTHTAALDTETEARRQTLLAACLKYCNCVY